MQAASLKCVNYFDNFNRLYCTQVTSQYFTNKNINYIIFELIKT